MIFANTILDSTYGAFLRKPGMFTEAITRGLRYITAGGRLLEKLTLSLLTHPVVAAVALSGPNLYACECVQPTFGDALKHASVVFQGTVVRVDHLNPIQP